MNSSQAGGDGVRWRAPGRWRPAMGRHRRPAGLAILTAAALGLAACSGPSTPQVASLGSGGAGDAPGATPTAATGATPTEGPGPTPTGGGNSTAAPTSNNATQLMDEWAACMRSNGDPNQTDPIVDQYGVINITTPDGLSPALSDEAHDGTGPCSSYELAAQNVLRGGQPAPAGPTMAQLVQYTDCMRTNGVPNYPDPGTNGRTDFNGTGVDLNSAAVKAANVICGKQIDAPAWWIAGTGPPGDVTVTSAGINANGGLPPRPTASGSPPTGGGVPATNGAARPNSGGGANG